MKYRTLLYFSELSLLATFLKMVRPAAYVANTLQRTVMARFSAFEVALPIATYSATALSQKAEA